MEDIIDIIVTETTNTIEITAQPNDEIIDVNIIDNREDIVLNVTPTVVEININTLTGNFGVFWGDIEGTLSNQTDLNNALALKANLVGGKVPASELPSYVDDVVEVANYAALPATGETGKIYITLDTNFIYRWTGSTYVEIKDSSAVWGAITGTLSNQTDLQNALDAKLSVTTAASTYVPYTGATGSVNLGTNDLSSRYLNANGGVALGGVVNIKQEGAYIPRGNGYSSIASSFVMFDFYAYTGASTYKQFGLRFDGLTDNTPSIYTLPNATGTLALTSDLHNAVTIGTANGLSLSTQVLSLGLASSSANGALSSTDWSTFNGKQNALNGTGFVKASGTTISYDNSTYALDSAVVKLTGNQSVGGIKTFTSGVSTELLWIKEGAGFANPAGYAQLATDITYFHFNNSNNTAYARFLYGSGLRTYTLPSSDGTLALTSALSAYLPLSGGTLTGALSGTSATFSGRVTGNGGISSKGGYATFEHNSAGAYPAYNTYFGAIGTNFSNANSELDIWNTVGGGFVFRKQTGASAQTALLTIASSGAATFSSSVTAGGSLIANTGTGATFRAIFSTTNQIEVGNYNLTDGYREFLIAGSPITFYTGNAGGGSVSPRMIINAAGNVGIGTAAPTSFASNTLQVNGSSSASIKITNSTSGGGNNQGLDILQAGTESYIWNRNSDVMSFGTSNTERMRITSGGQLLLGKTSSSDPTRIVDIVGNFYSSGGDSGYFWADRTGSISAIGWYATSSTIYLYSSSTGNIASINSSSGAYTALSDINKKKDFEDSAIGLNAIMGLKPKLFRMKNESAEVDKTLGFIAQEVKDYIPQAYVENNGFIGLNDRPIIAALTKAVQELKAELDTLKNK